MKVRALLCDLIAFAGLGLLTTGLAQWSSALACVVSGVVLLIAGIWGAVKCS